MALKLSIELGDLLEIDDVIYTVGCISPTSVGYLVRLERKYKEPKTMILRTHRETRLIKEGEIDGN